ncbi:MAG TPA: hypothetical protein VKB69_17030 [Micromonosporaceae bacterium]|nr:hypothetical protein [Micromonosporaceae bacterium]
MPPAISSSTRPAPYPAVAPHRDSARRRRSRRTTSKWPARRRALLILVLAAAVAALLVPFELAREAAADHLVRWADQLTHGSTVAMAVAGWLTYAFLPLAAVVLDRDHERRYGRPKPRPYPGRGHPDGEPDWTGTFYLTEVPRQASGRPAADPLTDTGHLVLRQRAARGHRLARRGPGHWLRRSPLLVALALAVLFLPLRGVNTDLVDRWRAAVSGAAFVNGWHWSMPAAALGVILIVMAPVFASAAPRRARQAPRTVLYLVAALLPLLALPAAALWA